MASYLAISMTNPLNKKTGFLIVFGELLYQRLSLLFLRGIPKLCMDGHGFTETVKEQ